MIIQPKVRGFICITAHPDGCAANVREQIAYVKSQPALARGPKKVLVIGASTFVATGTTISGNTTAGVGGGSAPAPAPSGGGCCGGGCGCR